MFPLSADAQFWVTLGLFSVVLVGIFTELVEKSLLAAAGAACVLLLGLLEPEGIFAAIDFNTLGLLLGMMLVVGVAMELRLFEWLSVGILRQTGGRPLLIFLLFMVATFVLSSILNNVTTILVLLPLTIGIARGIGMNPKPLVLGEIILANTGGLLTLIGDPVNTIVGSAASLGMLDFLRAMWIPVCLHAVLLLWFIYGMNRAQLRDIRTEFLKVLHNQLVIQRVEKEFTSAPFYRRDAFTAGGILILTIAAFLSADWLHLGPSQIALSAAAISLLVHHKRAPLERILHQVEWTTLGFFLGLFVLVGALEHTGVLEDLAKFIADVSSNPYVLLALLLSVTAVVSAFVDNIPFVTIMIPIIRALDQHQVVPDVHVLWYGLCLGAVMGGLASPFGSSANIVALATANKAGFRVSTPLYLRTSIIASVSGVLISYVYLVLAYDL
jgi:Na+/H+ antiporter NhaD/arsenite permease-like protein